MNGLTRGYARGGGLPGRPQKSGNSIKEGVFGTNTTSTTVSSDPVISLTGQVSVGGSGYPKGFGESGQPPKKRTPPDLERGAAPQRRRSRKIGGWIIRGARASCKREVRYDQPS